MQMSSIGADPYGYPLDSQPPTGLVALTPAVGWYACLKHDEAWFCRPFPMFMTVKRQQETNLDCFGVEMLLGRLERVDAGVNFFGYAHESEFLERGVTLKPEAICRLEGGEHMCADPRRVEAFSEIITAVQG